MSDRKHKCHNGQERLQEVQHSGTLKEKKFSNVECSSIFIFVVCNIFCSSLPSDTAEELDLK